MGKTHVQPAHFWDLMQLDHYHIDSFLLWYFDAISHIMNNNFQAFTRSLDAGDNFEHLRVPLAMVLSLGWPLPTAKSYSKPMKLVSQPKIRIRL